MKFTKRDPVLVLVLFFVTCGLYSIYWFWVTQDEINRVGGDIPHPILLLIPLANLYFLWKYSECFAKYVLRKEDQMIVYFLLFIVIGFVGMFLAQTEFNKLADAKEA